MTLLCGMVLSSPNPVLYLTVLVCTGSTAAPGVRQWKVSFRRTGCVAELLPTCTRASD